MDELERTVVQLWEAKRLAAWGDIPHGRLALLLLDNAAEISLRRTAGANMLEAEMYSNMAYSLRSVEPDDEEGQKLKAQIDARTLSNKQKKQIDRNFDALVDYVFRDEQHALAIEYGECLKILHRYRNAAYHRDTIRADILGPAVQILFFLCCHLIKSERQLISEIREAPSGILEVLDGDLPVSRWPAHSFDTQTIAHHVADRLLDQLRLDNYGIAKALSEHLIARLDNLVRDLDEIGASVPPGITRWATLRLVQQAPEKLEDFHAEPADDFWTRPLPITEEVIESWFSGARSLRAIPVAHDALRAFAEIERPLEGIEEPVARFIWDIERLKQQRLDYLRGK
ncbi:hypothetical protein GCM10009733_014180 [Nonomuraea maheshkhaliensis]|uniref:HEPN AbiU2-like domain-containing protein n=1 Tax=Nonomuraea maheshkhaliensis TaxID=419590 RepID=A0ABP4QTT5_9ACTN